MDIVYYMRMLIKYNKAYWIALVKLKKKNLSNLTPSASVYFNIQGSESKAFSHWNPVCILLILKHMGFFTQSCLWSSVDMINNNFSLFFVREVNSYGWLTLFHSPGFSCMFLICTSTTAGSKQAPELLQGCVNMHSVYLVNT